MNSRKSQTFVGRPAEPGVYYILIIKGGTSALGS